MCEDHCNPSNEKVVEQGLGAKKYWEDVMPKEFSIPEVSITLPDVPKEITKVEQLMPFARFLCNQPGLSRPHVGFTAYGEIKRGDKVLFAVQNRVDPLIVEAMARAIREKGAKVVVIVDDLGPDQELEEDSEIETVIRRGPWYENPRLMGDPTPWVLELAVRGKYNLLIHGIGGPPPDIPCTVRSFNWAKTDQFASAATTFPKEVNIMINNKTWDMIWKQGRGGKVHLTDPEGTDLTWTLFDDYYDGRWGWRGEMPQYGHMTAFPYTPHPKHIDAVGVCCGTTQHIGAPFPSIKLTVQDGRVDKIEGGGKYGDAWRNVWEETKNVQYPCFPRPGLFWIMEQAIGTNVKIARQKDVHMIGSGAMMWERMRSGIIHTGWGTMWRAPEEVWAAENKIAYGHLHVHLLFPTLEVTTKNGKKLTVINRGRLTVLDDPEVRKVASKYADPDLLLKEDWVAPIPGISVKGKYEDYAKNPRAYPMFSK